MRSRFGLVITLLRTGLDPAQVLVKLALRDALLGCESVLDIGCGVTMTMRQLGIPSTCGFEGYGPSVERARRKQTHDRIVQGNVLELGKFFRPKEFDGCVALDVIEHLRKEDGIMLMREMEKIARKRVVFFTPSGFLPQGHTEKDDYEVHLSGWEPSEMRDYGYKVIGLLGPKTLRGEYHALNRQPAFFWGMVSLLGHFTSTRNHPEKAAAILCVKDVSGT